MGIGLLRKAKQIRERDSEYEHIEELLNLHESFADKNIKTLVSQHNEIVNTPHYKKNTGRNRKYLIVQTFLPKTYEVSKDISITFG